MRQWTALLTRLEWLASIFRWDEKVDPRSRMALSYQ